MKAGEIVCRRWSYRTDVAREDKLRFKNTDVKKA